MILCIDTTALKTDPQKVQKDVNLKDLLLNHTRYYDSTEEAYKDKYVPLDFCMSVRSLYTNLVLEIDGKDKKLYYRNMTNVPEVIHKGYDLVMYMTGLGLMYDVVYHQGFEEIMVKYTQFQCLGLYNMNTDLMNPIIYSQVLLSDEGVDKMKPYLKDGRRFVPISSMRKKGNIIPILDTLIEVKPKKEGDDNE